MTAAASPFSTSRIASILPVLTSNQVATSRAGLVPMLSGLLSDDWAMARSRNRSVWSTSRPTTLLR
jgi:hypothetical protein